MLVENDYHFHSLFISPVKRKTFRNRTFLSVFIIFFFFKFLNTYTYINIRFRGIFLERRASRLARLSINVSRGIFRHSLGGIILNTR